MVEQRVIAGVHEFGDARGVWKIWFATPEVVATRFEGHLTIAVTEEVLTWLERRVAARGALHAFHDWQSMESYDSAARVGMVRWMREHPGALSSLTLLVRSKLVAMGVAAANALLGGHLHATTSRAEYDGALARRTSRAT
jgi:hypothetical protein